jgi:signal transduction histidine kinase/ligand-binding sensor domain-containing protein
LPAPPEAIAQTRDGYLWIGTDAGLVRFDGVRFVPWASPRGEKLPSDQILNLLSADGSLWIGTAKGLARWKGGILTTYKNLAGSISGIVEDHHGDIWIVRWGNLDGRGPLCRIRDSDVRCFGRNDGIPLPTATGLALDSSGNFWISGNRGLCKWKPGGSSVYFHRDLAERGYLMGVDALSLLNESHVWIGLQQPNGNLQLQELDHGKWTTDSLPKAQGPPPSTNVLFRDREGALWIGTASDGVYRIFGDTTDHFSSADGLSSDSVERFFQDREGILWVATTKGIDSFRDLPVVSYSIKEGLVSDSVSTILASHDGGVWIGGAEALGFLKQDKLSAIRTNHGLPGRDITTMSEDRHGRLWIGLDSTLSLLDHGHFLPIRKTDGSSLGIVFGIAEDAAGNEWAMTDDKLFRIENLKVRQQISLPQECFSIVGDSKEGVWLGCANGDLAHYYSDRSERFPRVSATNIRQLLPEPGGGLWVVAENALIWWNDNKSATMTTRNGLPCDKLYAAVKDDAGALWLYARCGLLSIAPSELTLWHQDPSLQVKVEALDVYDGAQPGITPLQPQATRSLDGRLWFANNNIVQTFDPGKWRRNTLPPNVLVERFAANGVSYPIQRDLKLPALIRNLEIDYTALSFVVPQKVHFRYKLEGRDQDWQEAGTRRQAFYTDLPPGSYRFRVIACNNDGVWNHAGAFLEFSIAPALYQTLWFRAVCLVIFVVLLWTLYQLRLQGVKQRYLERSRAQEALRRAQAELAHINRVTTLGELTASLAHDIKQPIGAAVTNAEACLRFLDRDQPDVPEAREAALEMTRDGRRAADIIDRVRSLYRKGSSQREMVDVNQVIREIVAMLFNEANQYCVTMRTDLAESLPKVMADRVQLQQVLMNLMLNSIEAMRDTAGELSIESELTGDGQLLISVTDTGVGLPSGKADQIFNAFFTTKSQGTGMGLAITRSIVESHGGRVWATPNSGRGTTFQFTLPSTPGKSV